MRPEVHPPVAVLRGMISSVPSPESWRFSVEVVYSWTSLL
jgi:hypothetical protein